MESPRSEPSYSAETTLASERSRVTIDRRMPSHRRLAGGALVAAAFLLLSLISLAPLPASAAITLVVTTTQTDIEIGDGCGLREAISAASQDAQFGDCFGEAGTNAIEFDISGSPPHTIAPTSSLPFIEGPVSIDARTEPDYSGTPVVVLDGSAAGLGSGLRINAAGAGTTIAGLAIHSFPDHGITMTLGADGNTVRANFIGTDATGATDLGNWLEDGIQANTEDNVIGGPSAGDGNLVSGNGGNRITIGEGSVVQGGNLVGTDAAGTSPLGNALTGIWSRPRRRRRRLRVG